MHLPRALALSAAAVSLATCGALVPAGTASADPLVPIQSCGLGVTCDSNHAIFLVKDLGGGAYWNVTTNSLFVVTTGTNAAVDVVVAATMTGTMLIATAVDDGRGSLLLVNGLVIVRVQKALSGL